MLKLIIGISLSQYITNSISSYKYKINQDRPFKYFFIIDKMLVKTNLLANCNTLRNGDVVKLF